MIACLNCDTQNADGTVHCTKCGANLQTHKYQRSDDPLGSRVSKLETNFKKLVEVLNEDEEEETEPTTGGDGKPKSKRNAGGKPKRKFLFD